MSQRLAPWPFWNNGGAERRADETPTRPKLKLIEGSKAPRLERLSPRARLISLITMVAVVLFGVVSFHVVLSQGQFKLESLQSKADTQQNQYERLRLQVAQLESPERITSEAQDKLGMVTPDKVTPVAPKADDMPQGNTPTTPSGTTSPSGGDSLDNWSTVKPYLSSSTK